MRWNYPTTIYFGQGQIQQLAKLCDEHHMRKPLLVCDQYLLEQVWFKSIELMNSVLFSDFKSNPDELSVMRGVNLYHDKGCDSVIAMGGGSALDTAKSVALMVGQSRPIWDFIDEGDNYLRANKKGIAPIIAIPTTAGTGSEVGRAAVIVNSLTHAKHLIFHPKMLATAVILDPDLTLSVPPKLTAATGMDALAHCLEAYLAPGFHPMADGIALEGMRLIKQSLIKAYKNGCDTQARANMMAAATMGGTAFQKGLGLIHALSHPVGGLYDAHHGLLNAVFMPYVLQFNRDVIEEKCELLARYLDLDTHDFNGVYQWVMQLCQQLAIPSNLSELGIDDQRADEIATLAMQDPSAAGNPKPLTVDDCKKVFLMAL